MAKNDGSTVEFEGVVQELLPNALFRIKLANSAVVIGHLSGRMRKNNIRVILGDKVRVQMTPYDLTKCRIEYRDKS